MPTAAEERGLTSLQLDNGTVVHELQWPAQGIRNRVLLGVEEVSGRRVAVKIELTEGAVDRERRALAFLTAAGGPAPRLVAAARVVGGEYGGAPCLVTERVAGEPPTTIEGWKRLGEALARLSETPRHGDDLPTLDHNDFLALHQRRVSDLAEALGRDLADALPAVPPAYFNLPLVLTHGDPGPGNFLDNGVDGTLIDWEDAQVAPRGLDLGRAIFIAFLGSGPAGYVATEQGARAAAIRTGFSAEAEDWSPAEAERSWWFGVAGVQFAHLRLERESQPGVPSWLDAIEVLDAGPSGSQGFEPAGSFARCGCDAAAPPLAPAECESSPRSPSPRSTSPGSAPDKAGQSLQRAPVRVTAFSPPVVGARTSVGLGFDQYGGLVRIPEDRIDVELTFSRGAGVGFFDVRPQMIQALCDLADLLPAPHEPLTH